MNYALKPLRTLYTLVIYAITLCLFLLSRDKARRFRDKYLPEAKVPVYQSCNEQRTKWIQMKMKLFSRPCETRVLVILHLYYMEAWQEIKSYLLTLPCNYRLIVTHTDNPNKSVINAICQYKPDAEIRNYENRGYDIGPFIDVLRDIDLSQYDVVYKLHSKGITKKSIFIYGQTFKARDWFTNLYKGLFGIMRSRKVLALLSAKSGNAGLVAAKNLIVEDPVHKKHFCKQAAEKLGIEIPESYHFVAGTCFAIRAKLLEYVQILGLSINDFLPTVRGDFSLAHAMERLITLSVEKDGYSMVGLPVYIRNRHVLETWINRKFSGLRLLEDDRFTLDYDFFYRSCMENFRVWKYEIVTIQLKDIYRQWGENRIHLWEASPYKYLQGDKEDYAEYCDKNLELYPGSPEMTITRFENLMKSIEQKSFDERHMPVIHHDNVIADGQHRCCILLKKYGKDHKVKALRIHM